MTTAKVEVTGPVKRTVQVCCRFAAPLY